MSSIQQNLSDKLQAAVGALLRKHDVADAAANSIAPTLAVPKQAAHGDLTTPIALPLAKVLRQKPREIAVALQAELGDAGGLLERSEIAGPGHLNLFVRRAAWLDALASLLTAGGAEAVRSERGKHKRVLVEFVSANPTGPLHVAHGRGAVMGDTIARLMVAAGFDVEREYYINDLGNQVDVLAASVHWRYLELLGEPSERPEESYPGEYVREVAQVLVDRHGRRGVEIAREAWLGEVRAFATEALLERIKRDLDTFGVAFDHWVSERAMCTDEALQGVVEELRARGHTYVEDNKTWFRSTDFGDDKDRVLLRDDGRPTYFLGDVLYHRNKMARGYKKLINIFGADHGGYVARVRASIAALGYDASALHVIFIQMVSLTRGGEAVRMGKRLGTAVWLEDIVRDAGRDATRYMFLTRRADAQMDFDVDLARKKSLDNPVFYAQMGHARLCAIARRAQSEGHPEPPVQRATLEHLTLDDELALVKQLLRVGEVVADAAESQEPHQLVYFIQELIAAFHSYYTRNKNEAKVVSDDAHSTAARLLLCRALREVLAASLELLGVAAPEEMHLDEIDAHG